MLEVRSLDGATWDSFVESSPQGTVFSTTKWCSLMEPYIIYGCYKGPELVGGIIGFGRENFTSGNYNLTPYQGIIVKEIPKYTTKMSLHNQVAESLIIHLKEKYKKITIQNHYTFPDIRPFLWDGWKPVVKYTYVVNPDIEQAEKDTRYEITHGEGIKGECSIRGFVKLYNETFNRKGLKTPVQDNWFHEFWATMKPIAYRNSTAAVVFIQDSKRTYYILGASNGGNYRLLWDSMYKFKEVDMVGCNVKEIGLFKRGFGGELKVSLGATNV